MCPFRLIICYLSLRKKLDYISAEDFLFPLVCVKFKNVLPTHDIEIQFPPNPVSYRTYEERFHRHSRQTSLRNLRVIPHPSTLLHPSGKTDQGGLLTTPRSHPLFRIYFIGNFLGTLRNPPLITPAHL